MERFLKGIYTILTSLILVSVFLTTGTFAQETKTTPQIQAVVDNAKSSQAMNLVYQTSTVSSKWTPAVKTNEISGQPDKNVSIDAFALSIPQSVGKVKYRASVADEGWKDWVEGAQYIGSPDSNKALEALQIELEGDAAKKYDVYYRTNVKNFGWLDWAKNGEVAGTTGYSDNLQAVQVTYTEKGAAAPGATACASVDAEEYKDIDIDYSAHVSEKGWLAEVKDGEVAGTTGQSLNLEAVKVAVPELKEFGDNSAVIYDTQVQDIGWTPEVSNGAVSGTTGKALSAECLRVRLSGRASAAFDVYYRIHSAYYGWLDWAKNNEDAGTVGLATPAQAVQIQLVKKDGPAPGPTTRTTVNKEYLASRASIKYKTHVSNIGWQNDVVNGDIAGTTGQSLAVEALTVEMPNQTEGSSIVYQTHVSNIGWMDPVSNGEVSGTTGKAEQVEAFNISLTGEDSYSYDVYYRAHSQDYGWLGWAKNGESAGTTGGGKRLEALQIVLVPRGGEAPGPTDNAYVHIIPVVNENWLWPLDNYHTLSSGFGPRWGSYHYGIDIPAPSGTPIRAAKSGTVTICNWYYGYGQCVVITNDVSGEDTYYGHMSAFNTTAGAHVNQGDVIGFVGTTGNSTGNHLHLGIHDHGTWLNPLDKYK